MSCTELSASARALMHNLAKVSRTRQARGELNTGRHPSLTLHYYGTPKWTMSRYIRALVGILCKLLRLYAMTKMFLLILSALVAVATAAPSSGCHQQTPKGVSPGQSVNLTIESTSGITPRGYRLHVPQSYDENTPLPLLFSFHGRGKDGKFQEALSQFSNATYGFEGIAVYPEGVPVCDHSKS